ncbi:SPOR domain-containing protein [Maridesulfovibrio hydrothermalis]|uniref:Sporulation domain protein n=1 Tax=Maridesulfovibrio hydrothermalis AM13 = DSM 14728 TaxID=1121451 RepID=L0RBG7_9BACT|nr:SPOR domain-containing protein [Maridesulfovibrio hydrothermalis]CCO24104.1 Sporulation domain protein [Maridesulfovibrio hydrothermalis AM13 = DSM 14728]
MPLVTDAAPPGAQDKMPASDQNTSETVWTVRVASFLNADYAWEFMSYLKSNGYNPALIRLYDSKGRLWRVVQIGDYPEKSQAEISGQLFKKKSGLDYQIKSLPAALIEERRADSRKTPLPVNPVQAGGKAVTGSSKAGMLEQLHGISEEFFYEIDQQDVLRAVSQRQRNVILARIMIRRGYVEDGIKLYEKLVKIYSKDLDLREEYIGALIDNSDYEKASSLLRAWLNDNPQSPRAMRQDARLKLLIGDYTQQQATLGYLLRLRPGDTDSLSARAYGRQQGGDWLGAITSFSELIDKEPDNVEARKALSALLMQRRPRVAFTPSVYLQAEDTITTTLAGSFAMQLDHLTRGEVFYGNTRIYRPEGDGTEKVDKVVNQLAFLFKRDLTRTFIGVFGLGVYEGTASGASVAAGFDWHVHDEGVFSAMVDYNNPWLDEPSAANYDGRYSQLSLTYDGFYNDTWGLFLNGQVRQYVVDSDRLYGTKSLYNIILTRRLLADPDIFVSYSFYRSYFTYDDESYTPFEIVENEAIHTLSASFSKSICDTLFIEGVGGIRSDEFKTSMSYFGGPSFVLKFGPLQFNAGYEYSSDSGLAGGGETQLIRGGLSYVF